MKFFEVFDMLTADAGLKAVFEEVAAIKVAASKLTGNITVQRKKYRIRCWLKLRNRLMNC